MVFYLKYRPQTINELDSESVREALFQVLSLEHIPHAFLFTGPKGLGKTSAARILAKAVNCEQKSNKLKKKTEKLLEPCNNCKQCESITNGSNIDILEIDAASNRGIDEIRDLREKIKLTPAAARMKVYIIDEVHMLTTEAFNALLKTLEEPPRHALFVLCTTELAKVPDTIQSRCFQVKFIKATTADIARALKRISSAENFHITDEVITEISKLADGGFRDAVKILEELVATGEKEINIEVIEKKYKVSSIKHKVESMINSFGLHDTKSGLEIIQSVIDDGIDVRQFIQLLTKTIHSLMLDEAGVKTGDIQISKYKLELNELRELLILLNRAHGEMKYSVLPQLPIELAVIDWNDGVAGGVKSIESNGQKTKDDKHAERESEGKFTHSQTEVTVTSMRKQIGDIARVKILYGEKEIKANNEPVIQVNNFSLLNISNEEITKAWIDNFWQVYILEIKQYNHTIAGVLRSCQISQFDKEKLVIETAYKFHKERLSDVKILAVLESVCKTLTGKPVKVEVVLKG